MATQTLLNREISTPTAEIERMNAQNDPNTGIGNSDIAWLGRLVTKVEGTLEKLTDRIDQLKTSQESMRQAITIDQQQMRDAFRSEVHAVDCRVDKVEQELVRLRVIASAAVAIAMVITVGLGAIAVPRLFGDRPGVELKK